MSSTDNFQINAAYVASWKQVNPKLCNIKIDGKYLYYLNEKLNISNIYMQDILSNPNLYYSIDTIEEKDLFNIIKIHVNAIELKEKELEEKVRRLSEYGISN